jgi:hypothetical protein
VLKVSHLATAIVHTIATCAEQLRQLLTTPSSVSPAQPGISLLNHTKLTTVRRVAPTCGRGLAKSGAMLRRYVQQAFAVGLKPAFVCEAAHEK